MPNITTNHAITYTNTFQVSLHDKSNKKSLISRKNIVLKPWVKNIWKLAAIDTGNKVFNNGKSKIEMFFAPPNQWRRKNWVKCEEC